MVCFIRHLESAPPWDNLVRINYAVKVLVICLLLVQSSAFAESNAKKHETPGDNGRSVNGAGPSEDSASAGCQAQPGVLAEFAKGTAFNFPQMVNFLSSPDCLQNGRVIAQAAIARGNIKFDSDGPLRLDRYSDQLNGESLDSWQKVDSLVARTFPPLLRENPLPTKALLPLAAKVSFLSQEAGRDTWVTIIQQQLLAGDQMLADANSADGRKNAAGALAADLDRMGLEKPAIAQAMANRIQDMALAVQVDSLSKIFRALGAATTADPDLGAVFNLSAGALERGIEHGDRFYSALDRRSLMKMLYAGVKSSLGSNGDLEEAGTQFNLAITALAHGEPVNFKQVQLVYNQVVEVLGETNTQVALAHAVALSLTPESVYLGQAPRRRLILAGRNYPEVAFSLQKQFLNSLVALNQNSMNPSAWNQLRSDFLDPATADILTFSPDRIDPIWLREALGKGLVRDEEIEKKFPRLVLAYLGERERKLKQATHTTDGEAGVGMMAENLALVWTLSTVHYPALLQWAKRYEQHAQSQN